MIEKFHRIVLHGRENETWNSNCFFKNRTICTPIAIKNEVLSSGSAIELYSSADIGKDQLWDLFLTAELISIFAVLSVFQKLSITLSSQANFMQNRKFYQYFSVWMIQEHSTAFVNNGEHRVASQQKSKQRWIGYSCSPLSFPMAKCWFAEFQDGRVSISDESHRGRPNMATTPDMNISSYRIGWPSSENVQDDIVRITILTE